MQPAFSAAGPVAVPPRRPACRPAGRPELVCQHAQRSGRAGHLARRGDLRDRQRLLGCRRPLQARPRRTLDRRSSSITSAVAGSRSPRRPAQPGTLDELSGVSCLSATNCWAVGSRSGSQRGNLLEHLGTQGRWSVVATPAPQGQLYAVTCEAGNAQCWAVGSSSDFRHVITFRLIAGSWRYVRPAPLQASFVQVSGVACATADDCLLVGFATPAHGVGQALAERWNGRGWSRVSVAGELSGGGSLAGVGCGPGNSPTVCWAVGRTVTRAAGLIPIHPLVERWNGNSLTLVPSPPGSAGNYPGFTAIACASSTACQAVGSRGSGEDEALVLTEGWAGSSWSVERSPSPLYGFQTLSGVACPAAADCWAVGEGLTHSGSGSRMILEHFSPAA